MYSSILTNPKGKGKRDTYRQTSTSSYRHQLHQIGMLAVDEHD